MFYFGIMKNCCLFSIFRRFGRCGQALNCNAGQMHQDWCPTTGVAPLGCRHRLQPRACRRPRLQYAQSSNGCHCRGLARRAGSPIMPLRHAGRRAGAIAGEVFMHDTPDRAHWHEPKAGENAGFGKFKRQPLPYDRFMEAEGVPGYRGIGVRRVQDLPLVPWPRLGGRGSFIQLFGTEGLMGPLRRRSARRRRAQCRAASVRKSRAGGRRPRHHRSVAGGPEQAPRRSNGRRDRCSPFRSTLFTASSMRRARRPCYCAAPRRRT